MEKENNIEFEETVIKPEENNEQTNTKKDAGKGKEENTEKKSEDGKEENTEKKSEDGKQKVDWNSVTTDGLKKPESADGSSDKKTTQESAKEIDDLLSDYKKAATVDMRTPEGGDDKKQDDSWQHKPKRRSRKKKQKELIPDGILTGYLFLTLIDMFLPMAIATVNNLADKKNPINYRNLRLKQEQINELTPIADKVMEEINVKANPTVILLISFVSIYGLNFVNAKYGIDG